MTLEDFFTLTEMKDGLTAPARVEELVSVMKKEKDSLVKNASDATRQWTAVASTIAATENKECLDLFVKLDGLWFIDRWLKDAQTFGTEVSDCFVEEAISALLQAVEKLQIDNESLISSGICITVKSLLTYKSTKVQDRARSLFDSWKGKDVDVVSMSFEKVANCDPKLITEQPQSLSTADTVSTPKSVGDQKLECDEGGMIKISNDQDSSQIPSDRADSKDGCPDALASPATLNLAEGDISTGEEACPSDIKLEPQCTADPKQGSREAVSEVVKFANDVAEDTMDDNKAETVPDRISKVEVPSASDSIDILSRNDTTGAEGTSAKPDADADNSKDDLSLKNSFGNDTSRFADESKNGIDDMGSTEQKVLDQGDRCSVLEETKDQGTTISRLEDVGKSDEAKKHRKRERKYFGNTCGLARLTKSTRSTNILSQTSDMDLEDGTVDALEVARLVAKEVEREVVGYYGQSGSSSSSESTSRDGIRQPDSPESVSEGQDLQTDEAPMNDAPSRENLSPEASDKEPLTDSSGEDTKLKNHIQDLESSQVTDAVQEPEINAEKGICEFDLNQEFSSEDPDHQAETVSNPVSVVSASRAVMVPGMPATPLQFEGTLGWKGSAATSAFRPASPRRASDSEKALSGGGTSSSSRQRQDFLDIDLNVAEGGGDKIVNPVPGKQNMMLPGLPSGESSVELSPKRSERLKFDLNQIGEDGDVPASDWRMGGRMLGLQNFRRSPSPASSSSCMQPSMRNFDLNDNPFNGNNLSDQQPSLGESSSHKVNPYMGPPDDSVISILGTKVKKSAIPPQNSLPFSNGRASEPVIDASLLRGGTFMGLGPAVPYAQSVYGYNGLAMGPAVSFPSGPMYGPGGPIPYMFDSRGAPVMPQIIGSTSTVPSSTYQSSLVMNMMGAAPGPNGAAPLRPNLDLNSGYAVEGGNRDPAFFRQLFIPSHQGRPLEEQLRDNFRPFSSGASGGKRKEPDTGWELFPTNYKHHQPPHL